MYADYEAHYLADHYGIYESSSVIAERYNKCESILNDFVDAYMLPEPLPLTTEDALGFLTDLCQAMNIPHQKFTFNVDTYGR